MKNKVTRIYKKNKSSKKYIFITIILISLLFLAAYWGAFSKASETKEIEYINYWSKEKFVSSIETNTDLTLGSYVVLPGIINNREVKKYYVGSKEYLPNDKYYIEDTEVIQIYAEYKTLDSNITQGKNEKIIYFGECNQEAEDGTVNDPYKTVAKVNEEINNQITNNVELQRIKIVIKGTATLNSWFTCSKEVELIGYDENSILNITGDWKLQSKTTIKELKIKTTSTATNYTIYASGNELILGTDKHDDLKMIATGNKYLNVYGGNNVGTIIGNTNVIINSGTYNNILGGSNSKAISNGCTNLIINYAEVIGTVYGGSVNGTINGTNAGTNITIENGIFNAIYGGNNTGAITGNTNIKILNGKVTTLYGGSYNGAIVGNTNVIVSNGDITTLYAGNNTNKITGNTNIEVTNGIITTLYGGSNNGQITANSNVTVKGGTIRNTLYGGSYGSSIAKTKLNLTGGNIGIENTSGVSVYIGSNNNGTVTNSEIIASNITINNGGISALGNSTIELTGITSKLLLKGTESTANIKLVNSIINTDDKFYNSNIILENSTMEVKSLNSNLNDVSLDATSNLIINNNLNLKINGNLSGTGTLKLADNSQNYINGNIDGNFKVNIIENSSKAEHFINIIAGKKYTGNEFVFENEEYSKDVVSNSTTYWRFYKNTNGIQSIENIIYLDDVYGNDESEGTLQSPIKTIFKATNIMQENSQKSKIVIISDINLNNVTYTENSDYIGIGDSKKSILISNNDGKINFNKSILLTATANLNQNIEIENINVKATNNQIIYSNGNKFVAKSGVVTSGNITLYGGSNFKDVDTTYIEINSGNWNTIYGAGSGKNVTNSNVNIKGGSIATLYGGAVGAGVINQSIINTISGGTITNFYGGSYNGEFGANIVNNINGGTIGTLYGGNNSGIVNGTITNKITGGSIGTLYGGSNSATNNNDVATIINKGIITTIYGGSNTGINTSNIQLEINEGTINNSLYGGSNTGIIEDAVKLTINNGTFNGAILTGSYKGTIKGSITSTIKNGTFNGNVYGGCSEGNAEGDISLNIEGGTFNKNIYGSNYLGNAKNITININKDKETEMVFAKDITICGGSSGNCTINGNIELNMNKIKTSGTANLYGGSNAGTITGDIKFNIINSNFNGTTNLYGGSNAGTVTGNIGLNLENTNFNSTSNIYRGSNSANMVIPQDGTGITSSFNNVKTNANTVIYGGSNTGKITGNVEFNLSNGCFESDSCNAVVYGGSNTGEITGVLEFNAKDITFNNNVIVGSKEGITGVATNTINNCIVTKNIYLAKYIGKNINNVINTTVTNTQCSKLYVFGTYTEANAQINLVLKNLKGENEINILEVESGTQPDLSNCLNLTIQKETASSSEFPEVKLPQVINGKNIVVDNVDIFAEKEFNAVNMEVKNNATIDFERSVTITENFSGATDTNYGKLTVYAGMNIGGTITGTTTLEIGKIIGNNTNADSSFNATSVDSTTLVNKKIWKVGNLDEFNVVYVDGTNGNDANNGDSADCPVKSLKMAYLNAKIDDDHPEAIIVVCGGTTIEKWPASTNKQVKITSKYANVDYRDTNNAKIILASADTTVSSIVLQAKTTFEYLNLYTNGIQQYIYANGNELILGVKDEPNSFVVKDINTSTGVINETNKLLNVYGGTYNSVVANVKLIINSGTYKSIYAGSSNSYKVGTDSTKGTIVENIIINGGTFGNSATEATIVLGSTGDTNGGIKFLVSNANINGYVYTTGHKGITYGNVEVNVGANTNINNWLFADGYQARIASGYKYVLNASDENTESSIKVANIMVGSNLKNISSPEYTLNIGSVQNKSTVNVTSIYYGSLTNSGTADTVKGAATINLNNKSKVSNIYCARYTNDTTATGNFYINVNTEEELTTNIYKSNINKNGGVPSICKVSFNDKNINCSGIIDGVTNLDITDSEINFSGSKLIGSNIKLNNSAVNFNNTTTTFSASENLILENNSNVNLNTKTNSLTFKNINLPSGSILKIPTTTQRINVTGNFSGGGKLYLSDKVIFTITGTATNSTNVYCNTQDKYFENNATIVANSNSNVNAFKNPEGNTWNTKISLDTSKRIWQVQEFKNTEYIYINANTGTDYGLGTKELPVKTLDSAYKIANARYNENLNIKKYYILLQTSLTLSAETSTILNDNINVVITNKILDNNGKVINGDTYNTSLNINKEKFNFAGNTTMQNLTINTNSYSAGSVEFFGNGYNVILGEGLTINSPASKYPIIYGGSETNEINKSFYSLKVLSGKYNMIFGAGKNSFVKSTISVIIGDEKNRPNLNGYGSDSNDYTGIYGAGRYGNTEGNINLTIDNGDFYRIYGAGYSGTVKGNIIVNYNKGTTDRIYGGGNKGEITGTTELNIGYIDNTKEAIISEYIRGSGLTSGVSGKVTINVKKGAQIGENVKFACGGYSGNAANTNLNINNCTIACDIYGGGWGIQGDKTKGKASATTININNSNITGNIYGGGNFGQSSSTNINISTSTITGNVYGGGNEAEISGSTNVKITSTIVGNTVYGGGKGETAVVKGNSTVSLYGNTLVKESVFGGGNSANNGIVKSNLSNCRVYIYGATIEGNIYGGANTAVVYGNTNVEIKTLSNIDIKGSIFGGGKSNKAGSESYDFSFISVTGNSNISINNENSDKYNLNIGNNIFASGDAATISGDGTIQIQNYGTESTPKKLVSIQRAKDVVINNSSLWINGTTDRTNELSDINYTINKVTNLTLKNNGCLYLNNGVNLVENLYSMDNNNNYEKVTIKDNVVQQNTNNKIYLAQGKNLILSSENVTYGTVNGIMYLGKYILIENDTKIETAMHKYNIGEEVKKEYVDYFFRNSYVQSKNYTAEEQKEHGFYTKDINKENNKIIVQYILPEPEDANYHQWILKVDAEDIYYEDIELIASKYVAESKEKVKLTGLSNPNTVYEIVEVTAYNWNEDAQIIDKVKILNVAGNIEDANKKFALTMNNGMQGWQTSGETYYLLDYSENGIKTNIENTKKYVKDASNLAPELEFSLIYSSNFTETIKLGQLKIRIKAYYYTQEQEYIEKNAYIILDLKTKILTSDIEYYEGAISPGLKYNEFIDTPTNITSKSAFSAFYSLYLDKYSQKEYNKDYDGYYHCLTTTTPLPEKTKITMIDNSFNTSNYYYYVVTKDDYNNKKKEYKFTDFIQMGSDTKKYNSDKAYYNKDKDYVIEKFIFQVDFEEISLDKDMLNQSIRIELKERTSKTTMLMVNYESYPMIYNIYADKEVNNTIEITPANINYNITDNENIAKELNLNIRTNYLYSQVESNIIYDTTNISKAEGLKFSFYKGTEQLKYTDIENTIITYKDKQYFVKNDNSNSILIKIADVVSNTENEFEVLFNVIQDKVNYDDKYYIIVETVVLNEGNEEEKQISTASVTLTFNNMEYGLKAELDENSQIINKQTGNTLNDNNNLNFTVNHSSQFKNPKIKVAIARREYIDNIIYSSNYTNVDLKNYVSNNLGTSNNNEYEIIDNPKESQNISLKLKENLKQGSYKIKFILYDGEEKIGEVYNMIIIK